MFVFTLDSVASPDMTYYTDTRFIQFQQIAFTVGRAYQLTLSTLVVRMGKFLFSIFACIRSFNNNIE